MLCTYKYMHHIPAYASCRKSFSLPLSSSHTSTHTLKHTHNTHNTNTQDIAKVVTHFQPTLFEQAALMHIMYRFPAMQARMTCDNSEPWHLLYR